MVVVVDLLRKLKKLNSSEQSRVVTYYPKQKQWLLKSLLAKEGKTISGWLRTKMDEYIKEMSKDVRKKTSQD